MRYAPLNDAPGKGLHESEHLWKEVYTIWYNYRCFSRPGRATANELVSQGAKVALLTRGKERLETAKKEVSATLTSVAGLSLAVMLLKT